MSLSELREESGTTYCTIITADYIHYALSLYDSLRAFCPYVSLKVLIVDREEDGGGLARTYPEVDIRYWEQYCKVGTGREIARKYHQGDLDRFRWSMKPVFLTGLLDEGFSQAFFLDPDLYFFASPEPLSEALRGSALLLSPHWRCPDPESDPRNFQHLQTNGLFNAGFIGATQAGRGALEWWARACLYRCEKEPDKGNFHDQAYLDLMPVYFEGVEILRDRGCNVANWNQTECRRELKEDGSVLINGRWGIIFIHFTASTIRGIESGMDALLAPYLASYRRTLERNAARARGELPCEQHDSVPKGRSHQEDPGGEDGAEGDSFDVGGQEVVSTAFVPTTLQAGNLDVFLRRRSILRALQGRIGEFRGRLLVVGWYGMQYREYVPQLSSAGQYVIIDVGNTTRGAPRVKPDVIWDGGHLPFVDNSFGTVMAAEALEYCVDLYATLRELNRILKPGGVLFFTVPFLWALHEVPRDKYRYTPFALKHYLMQAGFKRIDISALGGWHASMAQMLGLWVRRAPMSVGHRRCLSLILRPLIRYLISRDSSPTTFTEGAMVIGLSGVARA